MSVKDGWQTYNDLRKERTGLFVFIILNLCLYIANVIIGWKRFFWNEIHNMIHGELRGYELCVTIFHSCYGFVFSVAFFVLVMCYDLSGYIESKQA